MRWRLRGRRWTVSSYYRLCCNFCGYEWIGEPYRKDGTDETCPECDLDDFEVGDQYRPFSIREAFWIVLLIHSSILWGAM